LSCVRSAGDQAVLLAGAAEAVGESEGDALVVGAETCSVRVLAEWKALGRSPEEKASEESECVGVESADSALAIEALPAEARRAFRSTGPSVGAVEENDNEAAAFSLALLD